MWRGVMDKAKETGDKETTQQAEVQLKNVQDEIDKLMTFRKKLKRYSSAYEYITQIVDLGEPDLEVFSSFAKLLSHKLDGISVDEIDISSLVLSDFKLKSLSDRVILPDDNTVLKPMTTGGKGKGGRKDSLKVIVAKINEIWGNDVSTDVGARTINAIADYVASDDVSRIQIQNTTNSKEAIIADGRMERIIQLAAIALKNNEFGALADKIIADPQTWRPLADIIYDLVDKNKRIDMPEFMQFIKSDKK
jgi:type I restriction enzyme R subunit